jgi:hypothetical protein
MKTIFKYPLKVTDVQTVEMHRNAQILTVQVQGETPCIWALVDTEEQMWRYEFKTYDTGGFMGASHGSYVGTYQLAEGRLVYHIFKTNE